MNPAPEIEASFHRIIPPERGAISRSSEFPSTVRASEFSLVTQVSDRRSNTSENQ